MTCKEYARIFSSVSPRDATTAEVGAMQRHFLLCKKCRKASRPGGAYDHIASPETKPLTNAEVKQICDKARRDPEAF